MKKIKPYCLLVSLLGIFATAPLFAFTPLLTSVIFSKILPDNTDGLCPIWEASCQGQKHFSDGSSYIGNFRFGRPHGKGTMVWEDGSKYIGEFVNGKRHGIGTFTFADGTAYEGEWVDGVMEGQGAYTWACGNEYIGTFKADQMNGDGAILMVNGESFKGSWKNGVIDGLGTYSRMDGSEFVGNFQNGLKEGVGKIVWQSGDTLTGNWTLGKLDGFIRYQFHNGDELRSIWDDGDLLEEFVYLTQDGKSIPGNLFDVEIQLNRVDGNLLEDFQDNMQLGLYSFAQEYKNRDLYDDASQYLQLSRDYSPLPSKLNSVIALQLKELEEKQTKQGWAKLE